MLRLRLPLAAAATMAALAGCKPAETSARATPAPAEAVADGAIVTAADSISALADRGRIQGAASATVWLVESSDFQCPYCKTWHDQTYPAVVRDYVNTGKVRIAYLNYPLNIHPNAKPAAEAAMCASAQGKFWPMHDKLFGTQERWEGMRNAVPYFDSLATSLGVEMSGWRRCVTEHLTLPLIEADAERSQRAGVQSTPTFFVGEELVAGAQPYPVFRAAIERALAKATKAPAR